MSKKTWIIIIILIAGMFGFLWYGGQADKKEIDKAGQTANADPKKIVDDDYMTGSKEKKIVVMEYLDFECPGCKGLYPLMKEAQQKYADKVTFVHRYFPLTNIHPNALASARAAEAAGKQGKFFEMEELLFTHQDTWKGPATTSQAQKVFEGFAQQLGLNIEQFKKDFASGEALERINRDRSTGGKLKVESTPTVFLNGEKINLENQTDLTAAIDEAIRLNKTDPVNAQP